MNYKKQIDKIIKKIDSNMEKITHPNLSGLSKNGVYSEEIKSFLHLEQWIFSFYTGMVFHAYNYTKDGKYLKYLHNFEPMYRDKIFNHSMETIHDLGFLYTLYSVAMYKTTGDLKAKETAIKAADELAKRFNIYGKYINAWGKMDQGDGEQVGLMIADCMMNLPLLFWANKETKHIFYKHVAMAHADTTMKYLVRDDYSVCHAYKFERDTGVPEGERNDCGYAVGSAWARGTAWTIYGFAIAYSYTKKNEYLDTAMKIADFFISNLKDDVIPVWDFRLDEKAPKLVDTSAASITACGLLEIAKYEKGNKYDYFETAKKMVERLSDSQFCTLDDNDEKVEGILKLAQGGLSQVMAMWGDYFYVEALMRLENCNEMYW